MTVVVLLLYNGFTMQSTTTISQKGQIVVPKAIRDYLNIKPTDKLTVNMEGKRIIVEPVLSVDQAYGMFEAKKIISKRDIKEAAKKASIKKYLATLE